MITSGGIEGLELVGKAFLDRGDIVVIEAPTYLGAIMAFRSFEAKVVAVPIDEHGLDVDELERRLAGGLRPKLLYTIPDHQNPAGVSLSAERRTALVDLARRYGFLIVEDVAYRELSLRRRRAAEPLERRAGHRRAGWDDVEDVLPGRAARLGGRPGGGLGAARRGEAEHRPVRRRASGSGSSRSTSAAAGSTSSSRSRARSTERKCERMLAALERHMPEGVRWTHPRGRLLHLADPAGRRRRVRPRAAGRRAWRRDHPRRAVLRRRARAAATSGCRSASSTKALIDEGIERLASLVASEGACAACEDGGDVRA